MKKVDQQIPSQADRDKAALNQAFEDLIANTRIRADEEIRRLKALQERIFGKNEREISKE